MRLLQIWLTHMTHLNLYKNNLALILIQPKKRFRFLLISQGIQDT